MTIDLENIEKIILGDKNCFAASYIENVESVETVFHDACPVPYLEIVYDGGNVQVVRFDTVTRIIYRME